MAYQFIRDHIPHLETDREIYKEIDAMVEIIHSGELLSDGESAIGMLRA